MKRWIKQTLAGALTAICVATAGYQAKAEETIKEIPKYQTGITLPITSNPLSDEEIISAYIEFDNSGFHIKDSDNRIWHRNKQASMRFDNDVDISKEMLGEVAPVIRASLKKDVSKAKNNAQSICQSIIEKKFAPYLTGDNVDIQKAKLEKGCIGMEALNILTAQYGKKDVQFLKKASAFNQRLKGTANGFVDLLDNYIDMDASFDPNEMELAFENRIPSFGNSVLVHRHVIGDSNSLGFQTGDYSTGLEYNLDFKFSSYFIKKTKGKTDFGIGYRPEQQNLSVRWGEDMIPFKGGMFSFDLGISNGKPSVEAQYTKIREF